ncbi:hypothetical protein FACS1894154_12450 [Betaproteobacteria bacterium]|nr:hypothetical protein FACS1894154_12450 [Betaproteobacteria bacterium]
MPASAMTPQNPRQLARLVGQTHTQHLRPGRGVAGVLQHGEPQFGLIQHKTNNPAIAGIGGEETVHVDAGKLEHIKDAPQVSRQVFRENTDLSNRHALPPRVKYKGRHDT